MKKKILAILLTLSLISGMALPGTMAVEADAGSDVLSVETGSNASDETAYTGTLICELEEHAHSEGECYTLSEEPTCGLTQTHVHDDDSCYEMQEQKDEETGEEIQVKVLICGEEEIIPHEHGDGCYTAGELTCDTAESEGHTHGEGCYQTATASNCELAEDESHTHNDACYTETSSLVCTVTESEGHAHEAACYSASTLTCNQEEIPEHTHSADCYEMTLTCEKTEHQHTAECYQEEDTCTCGAEGLFHTSDCPLYAEPVTAAVYTEEDGVYTLLETHESANPLDMSAYNGKTVYILANTQPQNLYFTASGLVNTGVAYSVSESEYALLTSGDDKFTNHTALLTVAENAPAGTEFTLSAEGLIFTSYTVNVKVLDKLPADPTQPEISEVSADRKDAVEAVLADVIPALPENTTRSTYCFNIDPPANFVAGTAVEVVVPVGLSVAENVDVAVAVYHMNDDGSLKEVLEGAINEDGDIVFTTSSFSEFYFTVDFTYNGVKVSFDVGGDITLSLLMAMLGIDKGIQDVADVAITGDAAAYVFVEKLEIPDEYDEETGSIVREAYTDWELSNEEPFTVEGILTITFRDGTSVAILVTDALAGSENEDGETVGTETTWTITGNVTLNGTVTINSNTKLTVVAGGSYAIARGSAFKDTMFNVLSGGELEIKGSSNDARLIMDGSNAWTASEGIAKPTSAGVEATGSMIHVSGGTVTLENVTMQNGWKEVDGNAVNERGQGTAIYLQKPSDKDTTPTSPTKLEMTNCTITHMFATYGGSAIFFPDTLEDSKMTLSNCEITDNVVYYSPTNDRYADGNEGGAIRSIGGACATMTVSNCKFKNNVSSGSGGAIYWNAGGGDGLTLCNVSIEYNNASEKGGGILIMSKVTLGDNVTFSNNSASNGGGLAFVPMNSGSSVAIYTTDGSTDVNKIRTNMTNPSLELGDTVRFTENTASQCGGGIYIEVGNAYWNTMAAQKKWVMAPIEMNLTLNGATVTGNQATKAGGGIYMCAVKLNNLEIDEKTTSTLRFICGTVSKNKAADGGGIYLKGIPVELGQANQTTLLQNNDATIGSGGGLYVDGTEELLSQTASITVNSATVSENKAILYGGGIYCDGAGMTYSVGTISENEAACGGGICVDGGGTLTISGGGFITKNKAVGAPDSETTTAYDTAPAGTGGGIAVIGGTETSSSSFTLTGDEIGIYNNNANFAADDVFADGTHTSLNVPDVKQMNLSGMSGAKPDGWFEDYHKDDTQYNSGTEMITDTTTDEIIRYRDGATLDPPNIHKITNQSYNTASTYVCMTLGVSFGSLTISKSGYDETLDPNQSFIFYVKGTDEKTNHINLTVVLSAANNWTTTIQTLPLGEYKVTEQDGWSWRYDPKENTGTQTKELTADVLAGYVSFENERKQNLWLDGNSWCWNLFEDSGIVRKSPDDED